MTNRYSHIPKSFEFYLTTRDVGTLKPWKNEAARRKVLAEKHRRGTVARTERAKRKKAWSTCKGVKE